MGFETVAFYVFSFLTALMFSITVLTKNPLYAMTSLASGMIFISGFFFLLNADFLGIVQIIVYTGAVIALYAFAMIFFDSSQDVQESKSNEKIIFLLGGLSAVLLTVILSAPVYSDSVSALYPIHEGVGNSQDVGMVLFTKYLVPFEVAAVMLLAAMIAGIIMAGKKMDKNISYLKDLKDGLDK
jgi:NADH-quinone oxidoreductase subunit J